MLLVLKLTAAPILIGLMSLAIQRWGPTLGGLIAGLPWMTGPTLFVLGLEKGPVWVAEAARGALVATGGLAFFVGGYAWAARRWPWQISLLAGIVAFIAASLVIAKLAVSGPVAALIGAAAMLLNYALIHVPPGVAIPRTLPWWDIPVRMLATFVLVVVVAASTSTLGPEISGIASTFPIIMTVLGCFTHARYGGDAVRLLLRAMLLSLLSFTAFFVAVEPLVGRYGLIAAYSAGALAALATSALVVAVRRAARLH